jgi:haloalkane dehalogenase
MTGTEFPQAGRELFEAIKTADVGEAMLLDDNAFIEQTLSFTMAGQLGAADLAEYRKPYPTRDSRRPLLQWARSMPLDGEPADVAARVKAYDRWLAASPDVPKLLLDFEPGPGAMMVPEIIDWCAANGAGLEIERHGPAGHHTPEDQPEAIAKSIATWIGRHGLH